MRDLMSECEAMRHRFEAALGCERTEDWLSQYGVWLDVRGVDAETTDGWPTDEAFAEENVATFIATIIADREEEG